MFALKHGTNVVFWEGSINYFGNSLIPAEDGSLKPIIVENPSSVIAVSGSKINLSCKAWSSANSSLIFKWKRNNDDIYSQKTMIVNSTSFLEFSPVQSSDSGKYQCIVSNSFGTVYSEKAQLTVLG